MGQMPLAVASSTRQEDVTRRRAGSFGEVFVAGVLRWVVVQGQLPPVFAMALGQSVLVQNQELPATARTLGVPGIALVVPGPEDHAIGAV